MKKNLFKFLLILATIGIIANTGCKKKQLPDDEEELITTIKMNFKNTATNAVTTFTARDLDGEGGNPPVIDNISLLANANYELTLEFLNESVNPPEDITEEIEEEADDHLVIFKKSTSINISFNITDRDSKNLPVGLKSTVATGAISNGTITVLLKHQPGVKNGQEAPGSVDYEVTFNVNLTN